MQRGWKEARRNDPHSWESGQSLLWDFTCSDTLAPSNVEKTSTRGTAKVAESDAVEDPKRRKYASLIIMSTYLFSPFCIESLGAWDASARRIVHTIGLQI